MRWASIDTKGSIEVQRKYHIIAYAVVSFIIGLVFTLGFASWAAGESGNILDHFVPLLPFGMILGFFIGLIVYCFVASDVGLM